MKKSMFVLIALFIFSSCVKDLSVSNKMEESIANCVTFKDYQLPIQSDAITVAVMNGDTLAVTNSAMTIQVPKNASFAQTRGISDDMIQLTYINKSDLQYEELLKRTYCAGWQAVMFEDTKNGDYDFNDLIIHIRSMVETPYFDVEYAYQSISIQPIALGGIKTIGLGCVLSDGTTVTITDDVRKDLFNGNTKFINSNEDVAPIRYKLKQNVIKSHQLPRNGDKAYWLAWYITIEGGQRLYAVSGDLVYSNYTEVIDKNLLPYGLVIADDNGTFKYSKESVSIIDAYPEFKNWVYNGSSNIGKPDMSKIYKYSAFNLIDGKDNKKYKIWDWQDLE